jgi:RimJ/RimL family protein N-acetyltransferase
MAGPRHRTLIPLPQSLRSRRITLRPYTLDDAAALYDALQETRDNVRPWLGSWDQYQTVDDVRDLIVRAQARWLLREELTLGIFLTDGGRFIGNILMCRIDWELGRFEIGYWVRATEEGRGYVGEAVRLVTRCAFESLNARRLEIRCDEHNARSRLLAARQGFVREALLRNDRLNEAGELRNTLVFALIPQDYFRVKETWPD